MAFSLGLTFAADAGEHHDLLLRIAAPVGSSLPSSRLLLVFAHPDDEVLAVGARLERLRGSRLLTLTDGAPKNGADARQHGFPTLDAYRRSRRGELLMALADAGLPADFAPKLPGLVPDQAASFHLAALTRQVAAEIEAFTPEAVLTHPYEGGHPDHDACAFAVHTAVRLLAERSGTEAVPIAEAPSYHISDTGSMKTGEFLEAATPIVTQMLSPEEQGRKAARLACFASQAQTLQQFSLARERFRLAPVYDFGAAPHPGELLYERFQWGMQGEHFRALAGAALAELFPASGSEMMPE